MPWSCARRQASSAASWAANGVDLREPRKPRTPADAHATTEVLTALQLDSREDVDRMVATALANGASAVREPEDHGFMYGHAFADPDGHIWEPFWMNPDAMGGGQ